MKNCKRVGEKSAVCLQFFLVLIMKWVRAGGKLYTFRRAEKGKVFINDIIIFTVVIIVISLFKIIIHHRDLLLVTASLKAAEQEMLFQRCNAGTWTPAGEGLGAGLLSAALSSAESLCTFSICINFKNNIHRVQDTAELSSKKHKKPQSMEKYWKTKASSKPFDCCLGIYNRGTPERSPLTMWPCMAIWRTKMLLCLHKNYKWFFKWVEWEGHCSIESSCGDVGRVQCYFNSVHCLLHL